MNRTWNGIENDLESPPLRLDRARILETQRWMTAFREAMEARGCNKTGGWWKHRDGSAVSKEELREVASVGDVAMVANEADSHDVATGQSEVTLREPQTP